eukprot:6197449-Alexandrium_andersonii.AAC.1
MRCSHTIGQRKRAQRAAPANRAHARKRTHGQPPCLLAQAEHTGAPRSGARGTDDDRRGGPSRVLGFSPP